MRKRWITLWLAGPAMTALLAVLVTGGGTLTALLAGVSVASACAAIHSVVMQSLHRDAQALARYAGAEPPGARPTGPENALFEDVALTVQRSLQRALAGSQALTDETRALAAVLDGMEEGLWITDGDGTVRRHNAALARMLPQGQEVDGERPLAIVRSTDLAEAVTRACAEGITARLEITIDGDRPRLLSVTVSPVGGGLRGSSAVFHDVTELRRLEKVRKDFVANVSHELRTPITAIRGYAETLQAGALEHPAQANRMVEIIHRQSIRLAELVEDLLELSRLEAREAGLSEGPLEVAQTVGRAAETVVPKAEAKGVRLVVDVPEALRAVADDRGLETVLLNLLDNAVKYTPPGGEVRIHGEARGDRCVIVVQDSGVGIEPRHLSRVFERFYRVDKGRSRDMGGTGLGLSIVKHLVGGMGGEVQVESQPGSGSLFTVLLPLHRDSPSAG